MATEVKITDLVLNEVESRELYNKLSSTGKINENELYLVPDGIVTGTNTSVDNYTEAGWWWVTKDVVANTPNGGSGLLIVNTNAKGTIIYQTFISFNTGSGYFATRSYVNSQWYAWDQRPSVTPISAGGTGATTATDALTALGAAASTHKHSASDVNSGTLDSARLPTVPVSKGGTGATTAAAALTALGAAAASHNHSASNINSGTLDSARLPTIPISKGGTGKTTATDALAALGGLAKSSIVDDLTSDSTSAPLSAAMGKKLANMIDTSTRPLDKIVTGTDTSIDSYTTAGVYWLSSSTVTDTPNGGSGILTVISNSTKATVWQIFETFDTSNGYIAMRVYANSKWYDWDKRAASADYVKTMGKSGYWNYRIWGSGLKECWLQTDIQHEIKTAKGNMYYSSTVPYAYPVAFTGRPTMLCGVRALETTNNVVPIFAIPSSVASNEDSKLNAYIMLLSPTSVTSITTKIYIYACGM